MIDSQRRQRSSVVPIALRSLVKLGDKGGRLQRHARSAATAAASPGQLNTFDFDVPAGKPELGVTLTFAGQRRHRSRHARSTRTARRRARAPAESTHERRATHALQAYHANPRPGRWRFVVDVDEPGGRQRALGAVHRNVTFAAPHVDVSGLPNSASKVLKAGKPVKRDDQGPQRGTRHPRELFLDPRLHARGRTSRCWRSRPTRTSRCRSR